MQQGRVDSNAEYLSWGFSPKLASFAVPKHKTSPFGRSVSRHEVLHHHCCTLILLWRRTNAARTFMSISPRDCRSFRLLHQLPSSGTPMADRLRVGRSAKEKPGYLLGEPLARQDRHGSGRVSPSSPSK